jgi:hypothetical protein
LLWSKDEGWKKEKGRRRRRKQGGGLYSLGWLRIDTVPENEENDNRVMPPTVGVE